MAEAVPVQVHEEIPAASATMEEVSDVFLDFGVDSMPASSVLLRLASPVFNRMIQSGMKEAQQSIIKVEVVSKQDFEIFYNLLGPAAWSADKVTEKNVDALLAASDYYQVGFLKTACEDKLLALPASGHRLLQAHKHGLKRQHQRCIDSLGKGSTKGDLTTLRQAPDILLEVALRKQELLGLALKLQESLRTMRPDIQESSDIMAKNIPAFAVENIEGGIKGAWAGRISGLLQGRSHVHQTLTAVLREVPQVAP